MKPAVLYAAKSTTDEHGSIPTQLAGGRALAAELGLTVVGAFSDEAASAFHGNRGPGLVQAMAECERQVAAHGPCALIVQHSDRLARGDARQAKHLVEYALWAIKAGVQIISTQDPEMFSEGEMGLLLSTIGGMRNHQDSKRKGLAVKDGLRRRVTERRQFVGGRRPYGYQWSVVTGADGQPQIGKGGRVVRRLEPHARESTTVRRIFMEYVEGAPQNRIARGLVRDGVPTLMPGASWYATTVAGMLKNPLYVGRVVLGDEDFPGDHEPIIDAETWDLACELRQARQANGRPRGRRTAGRHLLTEGLLRCLCGAPMSPVTKRDTRAANRQGYETYVCVKRLHHGPEACSKPPITRELIDRSVYGYFEKVVLDTEMAGRNYREQQSRQLADTSAQLRQAEGELARVEARVARVTRGWQDDVIDDDEYVSQRESLVAERDAAQAQVDQQQRRQGEYETAIAAIDVEKEIASELAALGQMVAGRVQEASHQNLDSARAILKRLFAGFELASPEQPFGSGVLRGRAWAQTDDKDYELSLGSDYYLIAYIRPQAVDWKREDGLGFPALQRADIALHSNLCSRLAAW